MEHRERCGENEILTVRVVFAVIEQLQDFLEFLEMSFFRHSVSFIDYKIFDVIDLLQMLVSVLHQLPDSSRRSNDDVRLRLEDTFLFDLCEASDDTSDFDFGVFGDRLQMLVNLLCEFSGWCQDDRVKIVGVAFTFADDLLNALHDRNSKS